MTDTGSVSYKSGSSILNQCNVIVDVIGQPKNIILCYKGRL